MTTMLDALNNADLCLVEMEDAPIDLAQLAKVRLMANEANKDLSILRELIDNALGDEMGTYETVVDGYGHLKRHKRKSRTKWQTDDLRVAVLDSRLVDEDGVIADETPLDKILHVWNLGAPRTTALKVRGITNLDEFCTTETKPGWTIEDR
jgi:hypothetical protein